MNLSNHFGLMKSVIGSPKNFFDSLSLDLGYKKTTVFYLINTLVTILLSFLLSFIFNAKSQQFALFIGGMVVLIPLMLLFLFIGAGIFHLVAKIFGGKGKFVNSYQVLAYSSALTPLSAIPFINMLAGLYQIYVVILGFRKIHQYSITKAVITILLPVLIFFVITVVAVGIIGVALFKFLGTSGLKPEDLKNLQNMQNIQNPEDLKKLYPSFAPNPSDYPTDYNSADYPTQ